MIPTARNRGGRGIRVAAALWRTMVARMVKAWRFATQGRAVALIAAATVRPARRARKRALKQVKIVLKRARAVSAPVIRPYVQHHRRIRKRVDKRLAVARIDLGRWRALLDSSTSGTERRLPEGLKALKRRLKRIRRGVGRPIQVALKPLQRMLNRGRARYWGPVRGFHLKEPGQSYQRSFERGRSRLRVRYLAYRSVRRKQELFARYRSLARPVDLSQPFIYVALHFQPERTTSALGGFFTNQALMVDLIARCVPPGWRVYVKEHPSQFHRDPRYAGERGRHRGFYATLAAIPGVSLVPLSISPFELIDKSRVVATVTGTSGWEALVRGKPVMVFGTGAWYRSCQGVFYAASEAGCRAALQEIAQGYHPDELGLRRFMAAMDAVAVRANMGYGTLHELESGITDAESVNQLTAGLQRWAATRDIRAVR